MITEKDIESLFERGTIAEVYPTKEALVSHLRSDKPFHIYLGIDPTFDKIHLGHVQNILFLEDLRRLGAKVTLLFGSFTGLIGDPSGKESTRKQLTKADVFQNMRSWKRQVSPVLHMSWFGGARINYNNRWFDKFSSRDLLTLMQETTVQQLLERDMFERRLKEGKALYAHELVYPLLQGYDSVALQVDAELVGTDQTFNALTGRTMVRRYLDKEKYVIAMNLIEADGILMSKSTGTGVFVDVESGGHHRMFGSIMALPDGFVLPLFRGCTRVPMSEISEMQVAGVGARDAKLRLAFEIVKLFWGEKFSREASEAYVTQFQKGEVPTNAPRISVTFPTPLYDIVLEHCASSGADAKRKFAQGAVSLDGEKITDMKYSIEKKGEYVLRVGRHIFVVS